MVFNDKVEPILSNPPNEIRLRNKFEEEKNLMDKHSGGGGGIKKSEFQYIQLDLT